MLHPGYSLLWIFPPDNLGVLPTWISFWSSYAASCIVSTSHLHQTLSLPATLLPDSRVFSPSRMPWWRTPSPSFPLVYQVPLQSIPMIDTLTPPETLNSTRNGTPNLCNDWCYKPLLNQMFCLLQQPRWSQKTQCPAGPQCKMKHKQMTFLQHVHLHKANVFPPCPVNMSCCTAPPTKLSGQIRGGLLKTAGRG